MPATNIVAAAGTLSLAGHAPVLCTGITPAAGTLLVAGVTTEVCVHTTVREANDRGFRCIVLSDCCGSYFPEFHQVAVRMVCAQGGIFGWVADSSQFKRALASAVSAVPDQVCQESPS